LSQLNNDVLKKKRLARIKSVQTLFDEHKAANESLYRWWWECLRESEEYAAALRGERGEPYAGVAADFGQLGEHFTFWWEEAGRFLFGPAVYDAHVADLDAETPRRIGGAMAVWRDEARPCLYLRIPLTHDRRAIMREVGELVDTALSKRASDIAAASTPTRTFYPDQRIRLDTIKTLLAVWRARKDTEEQWWQTGERLGYWPQFTCQADKDEAEVKHKRRIMTLTVQRFHKTAAKLIDYSARGDFPRVK
jgi:hypothetical protein